MQPTKKRAGREIGFALLNLLFVCLILAGAQSILLRAHVSQAMGLPVLSVLIFLAYLAGYRWIERKPPPELKGITSIKEFFYGLAIGVALFSAVIAVLWMARVYNFHGRGTTAGLGAGALAALFAATLEETLIRGFLFRILQMVGSTWVALVLSSAFFGAAHGFNPGATVTSSVAIALEAGVLLAAAYIVTGSLWFPMGLHAGWNFSEGSLYGLAVSGFTPKNALTLGTLTGPAVLTGGAFGPEASIVAVILCLSAAILLLRRAGKLHRIQPAMWARKYSVAPPNAPLPASHPQP